MARAIGLEKIIEVEKVERFTSKLYDISIDELFSKTQKSHITFVRFITWYILVKKLGLSFSYIGMRYSMDHTSVMYGFKKASRPPLLAEVEQCVEKYDQNCG